MINYKKSWERLRDCIRDMITEFENVEIDTEKTISMWAVCKTIYTIMPGFLWTDDDEEGVDE